MRTIKKYSNRRLYDTKQSKVITLEDIAELIKEGEDIKVIDNSNGSDITTNVLLQTLLKIDQSEDKDSKIKNFLLKNLIKEYIEKPISVVKTITLAGMGLADLNKSDFENLINYLVKHGKDANQQNAEFMQETMNKTEKDIKQGAINFVHNLSSTLSFMKFLSENPITQRREQKTVNITNKKDIKVNKAKEKIKSEKDKLTINQTQTLNIQKEKITNNDMLISEMTLTIEKLREEIKRKDEMIKKYKAKYND